VLFGVGFWMAAPFDALATDYRAGTLLVISAGLMAGYLAAFGPVVCASVGVAVGGLVGGGISSGLLFGAGGLAAGLAIRGFPNWKPWRAWRRSRRERVFQRNWDRDLERMIRGETNRLHADRGEPREFHVRLINVLHGALVAVPLGFAVVPSRLDPVVWLTGGLVAVGYAAGHVSTSQITRYRRREVQLGELAQAWFAAVLALGPVGRWVVDTWRDHPWLYRNALLVVLGTAVLTIVVVQTATLVATRRRAPVGGAFVSPAGVVETLLGAGVFLFIASGVAHPDPVLLRRLWPYFAIRALLAVRVAAQPSPMSPLRRMDATLLFHGTMGFRDGTIRAWLPDAILHRRRPDFALVHTMAQEGISAVRGIGEPLAGRVIADASLSMPRLGEEALLWTDDAMRLVEIADRAARESLTARRLANYERGRDLAVAHVWSARANIHHALAFREEAIGDYRKAAEFWDRRHFVNLAVGARLGAAQLLLTRLSRPDEALTELTPHASDRRLTSLQRWRVGQLVAAARYAQAGVLAGDVALASVRRATWWGWWRLSVETRAAGLVTSLRAERALNNAFRVIPHIRRTLALEGGLITSTRDRRPPAELPVLITAGWGGGSATASMKRALALWRRGRYAEATRAGERAAELIEEDQLYPRAYGVRLALGMGLVEVDPVAAYRNLLRALDLQDQLRGRILDEESRIYVGGSVTAVYEQLVALLALGSLPAGADGWPARPRAAAFQLSERARSRVFLESLGGDVPLPAAIEADELVTSERAAFDAFRTASPDDLDALRSARRELVDCWDRLVEAGGRRAEYARLRRGDPLDYDEVRRLLPGIVLVEYFVTPDEVIIFRLTADTDEPDVVTVELARTELREVASAVHTGLREDPFGLGRRLADERLVRLVEPIRRWATPGQTVCLVPHDVLHYLPLHAVPVEEGGQTLADRNPTVVAPSASVLGYATARRKDTRTDALVLADPSVRRPLAFAREQAFSVADRFARSEVLVGADASRAVILDRPRTEDVVHFTAHGVYDEDEPMRSGIELADGRLTAADLMRAVLDVGLVTLGACESGLSERRPGDELLGLTRALLHAGAPAALVTLWRVDEISTSMLLTRFYRERERGGSTAGALGRAQVWLRRVTITDVRDYGTQAKARLSTDPAARVAIDLEIARLVLAGGDPAGAAAEYRQIAQTPGLAPEQRRACELGRLRAAVVDRAGRRERPEPLFADPYHWAAFVLIGDWR